MDTEFVSRHEVEGHEDIISSKAVRAGKRTYFIDIKTTRGGEYYLTITESRKRLHDDGSESYSRSQIYLYKEDFNKVMNGLTEMLDFVKEQKPEYFESQREPQGDIEE